MTCRLIFVICSNRLTTMQPEYLIGSINRLVFEWQKRGLAIDSRNHHAYQRANGISEVTWGNDGYVLKDNAFSSLSEYCSLIENQQYSMLLSDGAFFQISYQIHRQEVVSHRLCWYPSPIELPEYFEREEIVEIVLNKMSSGDLDDFKSRSPLRFDYAPSQAAEDHPHTHFHIGHEDCRIPVKSALSLRSFISFIANNFYPDLAVNPKMHDEVANWFCDDNLTQLQKERFHINIIPPNVIANY